ncbi:MAG: CHAD domain-containing protein [Pirellulales bacterium]
MGSNTKWIESRPDESARKVARRALAHHLARMWHYLELSVCETPQDTENVHQLRVFSRRATAVMDTFAQCAPQRRGAALVRRLKQVRKAAGAARDCDVLLLRWSEHVRHTPSSHAALLLEQIKRHRQTMQEPIEAVHRKLTRKQFARKAKKLIKRFRRSGARGGCGEQFRCFARVAFGQLVGPFLRAADGPLEDAAAMHAFRIQSKQVRYAMEIFGGAFDEEFRTQAYRLVETLQDRLGAINDHVTAQTYFAAWHSAAESAAVRAALEMGIEREQQDLEAGRREFFAWWTPARREELSRRFERYINIETGEQPPTAHCDRPLGP